MNRLSVVIAVVSLAATTFSADNEWDGNTYNYDGAFGLADQSSPGWSTATDIWTIRTPLLSDTPSGGLGYLSLLNAQSTTVTVTNSFSGKIVMNNFGPPLGPLAVTITNHIVSLNDGVMVTGAASGNAGGATADPSTALDITSPNGDLIILEEGAYLGGAGKQGLLMTGAPVGEAGILNVQGASIQGGNGDSYDATGAGSMSIGGVGLQQTGGQLIIDSQQQDADVIRGGNGGNDLYGFALGTASGSGGDGVFRFLFTSDLTLENGWIVGGDGGNVQATSTLDLKLSGGVGLNNDNGASTLNNGVISGGNGGTANVTTIGESSLVRGGTGVKMGSGTTESYIGMLEIRGGNGGAVTTPGAANSLDISGGHGLSITGYNAPVAVKGAQITAGNGGTLASSGSTNVNARGGEAVWVSGTGAGSLARLSVNGGAYTGGTGGTVTDATGSADVSGGRGAFISSGTTAEIGGNAVFTGGTSGSLNGVQGVQAVAIEVQDANVIITNGTFNGSKGLVTSTAGGSSSVEILGGTFGDVEFGGNDENLVLTGGSYNEVLLAGTGTKQLQLGDAATIDDRLVFAGAQVDVTQWKSDHFDNVLISNGVINIQNSDFNMTAGSAFTLVEKTAAANFGQNATLEGSVDLGSGSLTAASDVTVKSGSSIRSTIYADGTEIKGGTISAQTATFEDDVSWTLVNDGTITNSDSFSDGVLLASASVTDGITHSFDESGLDFDLIGNPSVLLGINGLTNYFNAGTSQQELYAMYGQLSLEKVFEDYPEMGPAMADLQMVLDTDPALAGYIASEWNDYDSLAADFSEAFIHTPEMASALMGLQGVFADQIKDRTRSNLRYKKFGSKTSYAPSGAGGPAWGGTSSAPSGARGPDWYENSVQWTQDHLPSWDAQESARNISDNAPMVDGDVVKNSVSSVTPKASGEGIEVPETYQVWGRAYGSRLDQDATTGFMGYDATIVGGVIGVDKRFEKMLIGLGAGYANTDLNGNGGNNGEADTAYAMGYFSHSSDSFFVDATLNYAFNDVDTEGASSVGYEAEYDASTVGFGIGTGYGMSFYKDKLLFTPEASYLGTYYNRGSYTEKSNLATPFPDKNYDSYDQWSHLTSVGATLSTIGVLDYFNAELEYQPELRAHWLHEFNAEMDGDTYTMVGGSGDPLAVALQAREEDLIRLGAGIRFSKWQSDKTEFGLDIDGAFGSDYQNFIVSGKIMHRF